MRKQKSQNSFGFLQHVRDLRIYRQSSILGKTKCKSANHDWECCKLFVPMINLFHGNGSNLTTRSNQAVKCIWLSKFNQQKSAKLKDLKNGQ